MVLIEQKKKAIEEKMYALTDKKREKFRDYLVSHFSDDDLRTMTSDTADKLLKYLNKL